MIAAAPVLTAALLAATEAAGALLVAGPESPPAERFREQAPERFFPVAGGGVQVAVAAGIALAGRRAVVLAGGDVPTRLPLDRLAGGGLVAITGDARVAGACWGAGWTLVQPAWPDDLAPLLESALANREPAVLRLPAGPWHGVHGQATGASARLPQGVRPEPLRIGRPRVLRTGTSGALAASGAVAVPLLEAVAQMLAGRGVALQALEFHTAAPAEGPGPLGSDGVLFTAARTVDLDHLGPGRWPPGLRPVAVPAEPRGAMEAVAAHLRARR